ncbi:aminotransferase class-III family protein, partial [Vibrio parahaemolyticus V-223/04]
VGFVINMTCY